MAIVGGVVATVAVVAGGFWARPRLFPTAVERAEAAYARRDYPAAATAGREAVKERPTDPAATLILARAYGRMKLDAAAQDLFGRLDPTLMRAEDYYLLGAGLIRADRPNPAVAVLERGREIDPDHPETLGEIARLYARLGRLGDATSAATRLAGLPGWESRGSLVLGVLRHEAGDPVAASAALARAIEVDPTLRDGMAPPAAVRKLLARGLLQTDRPGVAKGHLETVLKSGPDPEASWLLSRVFLLEEDAPRATAALASAGDFGRDDPTRPEPSSYVGARACATCHPAIVRSQQSSRHALTLYRSDTLAAIPLPAAPIPDPDRPGVTHDFNREGTITRLDVRDGDATRRAVVEFALGSGHHGLTMIGRDEAGAARSFRVSSFDHGHSWGPTPFTPPPDPADPGSIIGQRLTEAELHRCLDCHVTSPRAAKDPTVVEASDRGIGCERCHGPAANHLAAMAVKFPDPAIARPKLATAAQVTKVCAACHDSDDPKVSDSDPRTIRFQALTMPRSRCYTESAGGLSCLTCHDPHKDAETDPAYYESRCLACHSSTTADPPRHAALPPGRAKVPCPVNPARDCLKCHMPKTESKPHRASFTDHQIRVHRP